MRTQITQIVLSVFICVPFLFGDCEIPSTVEIHAPDRCKVYDEARRELLEYRIWRRWFQRWSRDLSTPIFDLDSLGFNGLPLRIVERPSMWDCNAQVAGYCTIGAYSFWANTIEFSRPHYDFLARDVLRHELAHAVESFFGETGEFIHIGHGTEGDPFVKALRAWIGFLYELPNGHPYLPQLKAACPMCDNSRTTLVTPYGPTITVRFAVVDDGCQVRVKSNDAQ